MMTSKPFVLASLLACASSAYAASAEAPYPAPAFTHQRPYDWLNSEPLRWEQLRGKVVFVEFWTYACSNCYRSVPWVKSLDERYRARGLQFIGVHTPELPWEYVRENVVKKVKEYGLTNPIMLDNDYSYWKAMHNQYWPAFYLVDRAGRVRASYVGETHPDEEKAREIESTIDALLAEK